MIVPCCGEMRELKGGHYHKIVEITDHAGRCLLDEYMVRLVKLLSYNYFMLKLESTSFRHPRGLLFILSCL